MCPDATIHGSLYSCICVLILLYVSSYSHICDLILHTAACVLIQLYMCPHTAIYVSAAALQISRDSKLKVSHTNSFRPHELIA
jgi:hypothetical protein